MGLFDRIFKKQGAPNAPAAQPTEAEKKPASSGLPFPQVTAKDLKDASSVIRRLVGKDIQGSKFTEINQGVMTHVVVDSTTKQVYRVVPQAEGWSVLLMDEPAPAGVTGGHIHTIWTTDADTSCNNARQLIEALLPNGPGLNLQYVCQAHETKADIHRKTFDSSAGIIRLHTRRAAGGTEGAIEMVQSKTCINFFHDAQTGVASVKGQSQAAPF
jgi:hypothetical protein